MVNLILSMPFLISPNLDYFKQNTDIIFQYVSLPIDIHVTRFIFYV